MDILSIILGLVLIALLPSFWLFMGGATLAAIGSPLGIILLIVWIAMLFFGARIIFQGLTKP